MMFPSLYGLAGSEKKRRIRSARLPAAADAAESQRHERIMRLIVPALGDNADMYAAARRMVRKRGVKVKSGPEISAEMARDLRAAIRRAERVLAKREK